MEAAAHSVDPFVSLLGIFTWYLAEFFERATIPWHASQRGRSGSES